MLIAAIAYRISKKFPFEAMAAKLDGKPFARGMAWCAVLGMLAVALLLARTGEKSLFIYFQF